MFVIFPTPLLTDFVSYIIFIFLKFNIMVTSIVIILTVVGSVFNWIQCLQQILSPKHLYSHNVYFDSSIFLGACHLT